MTAPLDAVAAEVVDVVLTHVGQDAGGPHDAVEQVLRDLVSGIVYAYAETVDGEWGCCHDGSELRAGGRPPMFDGDEFQPIPDGCEGMEIVRKYLGADR